jgi:DNA-binding MarR family transcriptional regulator/GNAT superfamily N-acetyltransferase
MTLISAQSKSEAVRRFNRFYTRRIGVLDDRYLHSPYSLPEVRVLYEVAHGTGTTATQLAHDLNLDLGYVSRLLTGLEQRGLIERHSSREDRRRSVISLSDAGQSAFAELDAMAHDGIAAMLEPLAPPDCDRLIQAMHTITTVLGTTVERSTPYLLRQPRPGDLGWVVQRHGVLYHREYGWNTQFEALVAEIVARFEQQFDPARERCWIAERDGENVGSVFLVKDPEQEHIAKLRLLLVEPSARGLGIGRHLVQECSHFARSVGYRMITLWTNSVLHAARRIYEADGYRLVHEEPHHSFGHDLVGQTWELTL